MRHHTHYETDGAKASPHAGGSSFMERRTLTEEVHGVTCGKAPA
jgi:hypothetical protein